MNMMPNLRSTVWPMLALTMLALAACGPTEQTPPSGSPVAAFVASYSGTNVTFDGRASTGGSLSHAWRFGDGDTASGAVVTHRYTATGTFTAELTVTDAVGRSDSTTVPLPVGRVVGALELEFGDEGVGTSLSPRPAGPESMDAPFVPGEVVVLFRDGVRTASADLTAAGVPLTRVRDLALPGAALYRAPLAAATAAGDDPTWALVAALRARPDVLDAQPNYILQAYAKPNDPLYELQWHYGAIGLEEAWGLTEGSASVVVAVLDTGILYHATNEALRHPDLLTKVVPGYDFVSLVTYANDGDGRDPDPYDPGDEPGGQSSYHGSHVAGTIGARTDDGFGVAGAGWRTRILPVRVLGAGGGTFSDVVDGLIWSAGFSVPGVPFNANPPARVANLSLGGVAPCGSIFQAAIDRVVGAGTTIVVAAGNDGASADASFPANCANVVAVGATDANGDRAWYSNHGPRIDVMAPGGDTRSGVSGGVYSLWRDDASGAFGHAYAQGTSMAAPHVAGVAALMLDREPGLTPAQVRALLKLTARSLSATACGNGEPLSVSDCGAGLIDAAAAVGAVGGTLPTPPGELAFEPGLLDFGPATTTLTLRLTNVGGSRLAWSIIDFVAAVGNPGPLVQGVVTASPRLGVLEAGATATVTIDIDRSLVTTPGSYRFDLAFDEDGVERRVPVRFELVGPDAVLPDEITYVGTFTVADGYEVTVFGLTIHETVPSDYDVLSMGGSVRVLAWLDANANGTPDAGDYVGEYPSPVSVAGGATVGPRDLVLEPFVGATELQVRVTRRFSEVSTTRE